MTEHFDPKPSVIVQRFRFNSRSRQEGESVAKFTAELQRLSEHCEFGAVLSDMLRDRLVVGIMNDRIQRRLLAEKELTFKRAYDLAIAHETAEKNTTELQREEASSAPGNPEGESVHQLQKQPVHQLQRQRVPKAGNRPTDKISGCCYRCGKQGHKQFECWFKDVKCFGCGKIGHAKVVCRTVRKMAQKGESGRSTYKIGYEEAQSDTNENEEVEWLNGNIHALHKGKEKPMKTTLTVQGQPLEVEIYTGASVSIVSKTTWKSVWKKGEAPLKVTKKTLKTYC